MPNMQMSAAFQFLVNEDHRSNDDLCNLSEMALGSSNGWPGSRTDSSFLSDCQACKLQLSNVSLRGQNIINLSESIKDSSHSE